jgi:hypothetical protein
MAGCPNNGNKDGLCSVSRPYQVETPNSKCEKCDVGMGICGCLKEDHTKTGL